MTDAQPERTTRDPRTLLESSMAELDRIIGWVSRRLCLANDEAEDFRSWALVRLVEGDYRVLRQFSGRSRLRTFLTAVVHNLARDYRTERWGRWRPSAAADRLGLVAVQLDTLLHRDGLSFDEAAQMLRLNHGVRLSLRELADLAAQLPLHPRRRFEGEETIVDLKSAVRADRSVAEEESRATLERTREALSAALEELQVEDRVILKMHYESGLTLSAIAAALGLPQRSLYSRRDRCLLQLRRELEARGVVAGEVLEALGWPASGFSVDYGVETEEPAQSRPSNGQETERSS